MGIFTKKKDQGARGQAVKEKAVKTAPVSDGKKTVKKESMKELYGDAKTAVKKTATAKNDQAVKVSGEAYRVLVKPLITEKAANLGTQNKYVFEVGVGSNKVEIEKAISEVYGVKPVSVNIVNMEGKLKRQGKKIGKRKDWKKAIITLAKGKTINIYEGV